MQAKLYFALLAAVLVLNAALSFYYAGLAKQNYQELLSMIAFKAQGARYTYDDGVHDRAERDRVDAALEDRIKALEGAKP